MAGPAILIIAAVLLGGGGNAFGLPNLAIQLLALSLLALKPDAVFSFLRDTPRPLAVLVLLTIALPLLQIVPLPPGLWAFLPGRRLVSESLSLAGHGDDWFPLSVTPARTLVAVLGTFAPFALLVMGWSLSRSGLALLQRLVVGLGVLCALLGMLLLLAGNSTGLYPEMPMKNVLFGTFANRNTTGLFLVCCLVLLVTLPADRPGWREAGLRGAGGVLLAVGVVLTQSRSSMTLLAVPMLIALVRAARTYGGLLVLPGKRFVWAAIAALLTCALLVAAAAVLHSDRGQRSLERFDSLEDNRPEMWEDTISSARRFWPVGSGMGTFADVFQVDESLEYVSQRIAGRAHNDYLEIALEAGIAGLLLVAGWLAWFTAASWRAQRRGAGWQAAGGAGIALCIALQSLVDYPLRTETMPCLLVLAILWLCRSAGQREPSQ